MEATYIQSIPKYDVSVLDQTVANYYKSATKLSRLPLAQRIDYFSQRLLGKPYLLGALGEGVAGQFDQNPLYRFDAFDCLTYVNTVLALSLSMSVNEFKSNMLRLNYHCAEPRYVNRHHFVSADWNRENAAQGLIRDITNAIVDAQGRSLAVSAETCIDRPNWFLHRCFSDIKLIKPVKKSEAKALLDALHALSSSLQSAVAVIEYVPIAAFFDAAGHPIAAMFDQIPDAAIVEIIRPSWDLKDKIGTHLHVSHIGFAIRVEGVLMYRQASSIEKRVVDIPLETYLYRRINSPTIKGINLQHPSI